jgi:hypothetical protein
MAQIDLKNATIYIRDGYAGSGGNGAINNASGYTAGATVLTVDGFVGHVTTGDYITIIGSETNGVLVRHKITAHTETSTNTTSITVTPGLGAAIVDDAIILALPHFIEVKIGEGNLTYSEKRNMIYTRDRGRLDTVREGDEDPMDISMEAIWEFIKADSGKIPTIEDVLKKRGEAAAWITTSDDECEPYAVDIEIYYDTPCTGDADEQIVLPMFRYEEIGHDLRAAQFNIKGKCNAKEAVINRVA